MKRAADIKHGLKTNSQHILVVSSFFPLFFLKNKQEFLHGFATTTTHFNPEFFQNKKEKRYIVNVNGKKKGKKKKIARQSECSCEIQKIKRNIHGDRKY